MAVRIPQYLLGRAITVSITPQTVSASGVFSNHSIGQLNFYGQIEEDSFESSLQTADYTSVRSFQANPVPVEYSASYLLTELMMAAPTVTSTILTGGFKGYGNILEAAISASWYHKVTVTVWQGVYHSTQTPSAVRTTTFYCLMTGLKRSSPKQRSVNSATFQLVAVGNGSGGFAANPAIS